jgi:hypothetical protein
MFTKQQVQDMIESDLRKQVLVPLLRAMNFQGVHEYHGNTEFGKDIVCWKFDELHNRKNLALVVKATPVSGQSKAAADIENQVRQCFSRPYVDLITGSSEEVDRCWIVSNKTISHDAVDHIKAGIGHAVHQKSVEFVDIDALWDLIEEYMPVQATLQKLEEVRQDYDTFDTHYRLEAQVSGSGIHHTLVEKFPGAAQEKPLEIRPVFEFPDTVDGRENLKALERFFEAGTPTKIPAAYIKSIEYSEFLQHVYPAMTKDGFLQFGSRPHPKPLLLRCEIFCDDGDHFVLDYIHLICTQAGQKEATLTNDGQLIPIRMQLVLHFDGKISGFHMSLDHDNPLNVHQKLMQMRLLCCFSKPHTVHFTNLETGMFVGYGRSEVGVCDAPNENALEALAALDALQIKSGRLVSLPDRELTDEEYQDIHMLRTLFHTGKHNATWNSSSASIVVADDTREEIGQMLRRLAEEGGFVYLQQDEILSLFGEEYALGPIKPLSLPAKLVNWLEVKARLDQGFCGELCLQMIPSDEGTFTKEYVQWLPKGDGASDVRLLPDHKE